MPSNNSNLSLFELSKRWEVCRASLEVLAENSSGDLNKGVFKHPSVGIMNFEHMLSFFHAHKGHHLMQISALLLATKSVGETLEFEDQPRTSTQPDLRSI